MSNKYDPNALTAALVAAIDASSKSQLTAADVAKTNTFSTINNQANHTGTLYSTAPATKQTQYLGATYVPQIANINQTALSNKLNAYSTLATTLHTIDAQNKAAKVLNGITFDQFGAGA